MTLSTCAGRFTENLRTVISLGPLLACIALGASGASGNDNPMDWLKKSWGEHAYLPPDAEETAQAEALFLALMEGADAFQLGEQASSIGYEFHVLQKDLLLLVESASRREGRGMFLFRTGPRVRLGFQAPHARSDLHTGKIVMRLMLEQPAAAGAINTVSRNAPIEGQDGVADMAHLDESFFMAFSRAFAQAFPSGRIVQLHGFAPGKRKTGAGRNSEAIVSAGQKTPTLDAISIRECLNYRYIDAVSLYPINVFELGGETNTIGRMLRKRGFLGFVHLELAPRPRRMLRKDPAARTDLMHCAARGVESVRP